MKSVVVASENPVKIKATLEGFKRVFPDERFTIRGVDVDSGVSNQPMTDEETMQGASNRAQTIKQKQPEADFAVGIEGGVERLGREMYTFAWVVVVANSKVGKGRTAAFALPPKVVALVRQGKELGDAMDELFGKDNSKQKEGAIGILTDGVIDRTKLYTPAVITALIPFTKPALYE